MKKSNAKGGKQPQPPGERPVFERGSIASYCKREEGEVVQSPRHGSGD